MIITVELYKENGIKKVYVAEECSSGEGYTYETADDIGKAVADYLDGYFSDIVENPNYFDDEEEM